MDVGGRGFYLKKGVPWNVSWGRLLPKLVKTIWHFWPQRDDRQWEVGGRGHKDYWGVGRHRITFPVWSWTRSDLSSLGFLFPVKTLDDLVVVHSCRPLLMVPGNALTLVESGGSGTTLQCMERTRHTLPLTQRLNKRFLCRMQYFPPYSREVGLDSESKDFG